MLQKECLIIVTAMGAVKKLFSEMNEIQIENLKIM